MESSALSSKTKKNPRFQKTRQVSDIYIDTTEKDGSARWGKPGRLQQECKKRRAHCGTKT
jgi:hypothetical protein